MAGGGEDGANETEIQAGAAPSDVVNARLGTVVDKYTIVRLLGRGGMGAVYEARHLKLSRRFAIKFLLPEAAANLEILRRFENEAKAAGGLEHPNVAAVTDFGRTADGTPYLVMEFLDGEDCGKLLRRTGPLAVRRAADLIIQACRGLAAAHAAGIVHRDIKPENLFVIASPDGRDIVKVLDFGIAKLQQADASVATGTGATFGTAYYMSPEQARGTGDVDARADVWSLGVVLYELLGARRPFEGEQFLHVIHQILSVAPPPLGGLRSGLPPKLVAVVERAMAKDVAARLPSVVALAEALAPFAGLESQPKSQAAEGPRTTLASAATMPGLEPPEADNQSRSSARGRRARLGPVVAGALAIAVVAGGIAAVRALRSKPELATAGRQAAPTASVTAEQPGRPVPAAAGQVPAPAPPLAAPAPAASAAPPSSPPAGVRTGFEQSGHRPPKRRTAVSAERKPVAPARAAAQLAPKPWPAATPPASSRAIDIEKDNPYGP